MNHDLDLAEKTAAALPQDWIPDFSFVGGYTLHVCGACLKTFHSFAGRDVCWQCRPTPEAKEPPCSES